MSPTKTVYIPAREQHEGIYGVKVTLYWLCPVCGAERGPVRETISYDGSRKLPCDGWTNPCGHIDYYSAVKKEAVENGLNKGEAE